MGEIRIMTYEIYKSSERGHVEAGWLKSRHSFSFGEYYDPKKMGFHSLRVINEDWIQAHSGFPMHPHQDMEIFTYVIEGAVSHKDSTGAEGDIKAGEVQLMRAGTGIVHSEMNRGDSDLHLYQIWITPDERGLKPGHEQISINEALNSGEWVEVLKPAASEGAAGALEIHQNVFVSSKRMKEGEEGSYLRSGSKAIWVQMVKGAANIDVDGERVALSQGDGLAMNEAEAFKYSTTKDAEILVFAFGK